MRAFPNPGTLLSLLVLGAQLVACQQTPAHADSGSQGEPNASALAPDPAAAPAASGEVAQAEPLEASAAPVQEPAAEASAVAPAAGVDAPPTAVQPAADLPEPVIPGATGGNIQPDDALAADFRTLRPDPQPDEIIRNSHYWVSNEYSHFLFRDTIANVGGAYMGVGTDQNYLLAGWARSELIIMLDFDGEIARAHDLYGIAFREATTPDEFLSIWRDDGEKRFADLVPTYYPDDVERQRLLLRAFEWGGTTIFARLRRIIRQYGDNGIPTFMTSQEEYDYLRNLWLTNRVFAIRGDLTGSLAIQDAAHMLRRHNIPMRVLYTSNAEQYFTFTPEFRRNMLVLPFDEQSWVVRTRPIEAWGLAPDDDYHYNVQDGLNFQLWMRGSSVSDCQRLMRNRSQTGVVGLSRLQAPLPDDATTPPVADAQWPEDVAQP
ncbi:MAG: hypothetical protein KGO50_09245 [Myxococcales bacterium]|nr:hypothetical protein [Myxococcales bacterium]